MLRRCHACRGGAGSCCAGWCFLGSQGSCRCFIFSASCPARFVEHGSIEVCTGWPEPFVVALVVIEDRSGTPAPQRQHSCGAAVFGARGPEGLVPGGKHRRTGLGHQVAAQPGGLGAEVNFTVEGGRIHSTRSRRRRRSGAKDHPSTVCQLCCFELPLFPGSRNREVTPTTDPLGCRRICQDCWQVVRRPTTSGRSQMGRGVQAHRGMPAGRRRVRPVG